MMIWIRSEDTPSQPQGIPNSPKRLLAIFTVWASLTSIMLAALWVLLTAARDLGTWIFETFIR